MCLLIKHKSLDYFDIGVPYPTEFHSTSDSVTWHEFVHTRICTTLFCFAGTTRGVIKNDFWGLLKPMIQLFGILPGGRLQWQTEDFLNQCYNLSGSQAKDMNSKSSFQVQSTSEEVNLVSPATVKAPAKKVVDINQPQTCKNKGCGQTFKEIDNHDTACNYHPGPAVFHDRMRGNSRQNQLIFGPTLRKAVCLHLNGVIKRQPLNHAEWKCCDIHVKEFDEFMTIQPCAKGWHNADPES